MKSLVTLSLLSLIFFGNTRAQTILYKQTFDSSYADWSLNTTDLGGDSTTLINEWGVNNSYMGGSIPFTGTTIPNTPEEPSGITGYPESNYLHIMGYMATTLGPITNCNFEASGFSTYFAKMNPISTTNDTGVTLSFWWLCLGDAGAVGKVYYSIDSGSSWIQITSPRSVFNNDTTWLKDSVHLAAFDGQRHLQFAFQFTEDTTGKDPAFAIDDIFITGTNITTGIPNMQNDISYSIISHGSDMEIIASEAIGEPKEVALFDLSGRVLVQGTWLPGNSSFTINSAGLSAGLYMIKIRGLNSSSVLKWEKP